VSVICSAPQMLNEKIISPIVIKPLLRCKLKQGQKNILLDFVKSLNGNTKVNLFNDLVDDLSKGGDVALELLTNYISHPQKELQYICFDILCNIYDSVLPEILEKKFNIDICFKLLCIPQKWAHFYTLKNLARLHNWLKYDFALITRRSFIELEYDFTNNLSLEQFISNDIQTIIDIISAPGKSLPPNSFLKDKDSESCLLNPNNLMKYTVAYLQQPPNKYVQINALKILTCLNKQNLRPYVKKIIDLLGHNDSRIINEVSSILSQLKYLSDADMIQIINVLKQLTVSYPNRVENINDSLVQILIQRGYLPTILTCFRVENHNLWHSDIKILQKVAHHSDDKNLEMVISHLIEHYSVKSINRFLCSFKCIPLCCYIKLLEYFGNTNCEEKYELYSNLCRLKPHASPIVYLGCAKKTAINNIRSKNQDIREHAIYYLSLLSDRLNQEELKLFLGVCLNENLWIDIWPPPRNRCFESIEFLLNSLESQDEKRCLCSINLLKYFHSKLKTKHINQIKFALNHEVLNR